MKGAKGAGWGVSLRNLGFERELGFGFGGGLEFELESGRSCGGKFVVCVGVSRLGSAGVLGFRGVDAVLDSCVGVGVGVGGIGPGRRLRCSHSSASSSVHSPGSSSRKGETAMVEAVLKLRA